jgi:hypothetical protein
LWENFIESWGELNKGESVRLQEGAQEVEKRLESLDALRGFANCRL